MENGTIRKHTEMKKSIYAILTLTLLISCTGDFDTLQDNGHACTNLSVCIGDDTRISMGELSGEKYPIAWQTGDRICVNGIGSEPLAAGYDGSKEASFTLPEAIEYPLTIVYPAELCNGTTIEIPADQQFDAGRMCSGYTVMAGYNALSGRTGLQHVCGYIRLQVKGSKDLKEITLRSIGNEIIAGKFRYNPESGILENIPDTAESIVSSSAIHMSCNAALTDTPAVFYISIPAGEYSKGLKVTMKDSDGNSMSKTMFTAGKTLSPGIVVDMPEVTYVPGSTEDEIFSVSDTSVEFEARLNGPQKLTISAFDEDVLVSSEGTEWIDCQLPAKIPAGRTYSMEISPLTANVCDARNATITFTGKQSSVAKTVTLSQENLYTPSYGFPSRWIIDKATTYYTNGEINASGRMWEEEGIATCTDGEGIGVSYVSAGSTVGNRLRYTVNLSASTKTLAVGNMAEGDYIQFSVPVIDLPADTNFDFMVTINAATTAAPKYWLFEYWDEGKWKCDESRLYTADEDSTIKYSFWIKHFSSANHRTYIAPFTKKEAVHNDFVKMRIRAVGKINGGGGVLKPAANSNVYLAGMMYDACDIVCYRDAPAVKDTKKICQFGNSITFFNASAFKIKEIARAEGHMLDYRINLKGSQEFKHHLYDLIFSQEVIREGGYDYAIIQDGSFYGAQYHLGDGVLEGPAIKFTSEEILRYSQEISTEIRKYAPTSQVILENVYSYSRKAYGDNYLGQGSFENFDSNQWAGNQEIAALSPNINWISPVGQAFALARSDYGFTSAYNYLQYTDNYHPNLYGSYLKACVYYLLIYGEKFGDNPSDCNVPATEAAKLREIAEKIVIGNRETYHVR